MRFVKIDSCESTNKLASEILLSDKQIPENTIVYTFNQLSGKGIYKSKWFSDKNKNLSFSIISFPNLDIENHFVLSMLISLGIVEYLEKFHNIIANVKWPNDILVNDKKICGILIENNLSENKIKSSIIGIGININQIKFPDYIPNPTSLSLEKNKSFNLNEELELLGNMLNDRINSINMYDFNDLNIHYLKKLFRFNIFANYKKNEDIFLAKIIDVNTDGSLKLIDKNANIFSCFFKEIEYIL
jgi:BirA family transcriptional regulator, biotin operon repressor / biotin---[acetyl-CoA-carboxylase] ligase